MSIANLSFFQFFVLLLLLHHHPTVHSQFQVVYRENSADNIYNSSQPVRFWELVEYRPTTTTQPPPPPPPTTTTTTTTTTVDPCESSLPQELTRRLRDATGYNRIYMASDFASASHTFPDLRGLAKKPQTEYKCGKHCQRSSQMIRKIIKTGKASEAERSWWDEGEWEENDQQRRSRRNKREQMWRDTSPDLLMKNTGISNSILGMTVAVECDEDTGEFNSGGYSLCTTCRAVRHLPEGKCIQRVMPMKILRNIGTKNCAKWQISSIDVRTCCDCILSPASPLVAYL
ncbi:unnamed protein product [Caenorhabditis angaria]|uniref:Bursicon n=1 Tax=Caenorhabditis angaria TaxID=860376 RepID=A0A9P1I5G3_9PELO|nr:unnamed protein product [Caenorhabditis angaria]